MCQFCRQQRQAFLRFLANVESVAQSTFDHLPLIQRHLDTERLSPATVQRTWINWEDLQHVFGIMGLHRPQAPTISLDRGGPIHNMWPKGGSCILIVL